MPNLRAALEEAIAANPDEAANHAAYADYLSEQGDARGELVQVQLALEDPATAGQRRQDLQKREKELLKAHERDWLGGLAPFILDQKKRKGGGDLVNRVTWRRGWVSEVYFWNPDVQKTRALARCPVARFLRSLDLLYVGYESDYEAEPDDGIPEGSEYPTLYPLQKAPFLPHLRFLRIGKQVDFDEEMHSSRASGEGVVDLVRLLPNLEELGLYVWDFDIERLFALRNLTRLRTLVIYHHHGNHPLSVLAKNPAFAALQTLRIHPGHTAGERCYLPRAEVVALLRSPHLRALRHLHLHASDLGDAGCAEIVHSGALKRLKVLDLRHGAIGDAGARALADCPDVRNLDLLDLSGNEISDAVADEIEERFGFGGKVRLGEQHERGSNYYLWTGDME